MIFDTDVSAVTTIVRTNFPGFNSPEKCQADRDALMGPKSSAGAKDIIAKSNKIMYADFISASDYITEEKAAESRAASRVNLLTHLRSCTTLYKPKKLDQLNDRIGAYETDKEIAVRKVLEIRAELAKQDINNKQLIANLQAQEVKHLAELEKTKADMARAVQQQMGGQRQQGGLFGTLGGMLDAAVPCSIM